MDAGRLAGEEEEEVETEREDAALVGAGAVEVSVGLTHFALPSETLVPSSHASAAAAPPRAVGSVPGTWRKAASAAGRLVTTRVGTKSGEEKEDDDEKTDDDAAADDAALANASMAAASSTPFATRSRTRFFRAALVASRANLDSWARPRAESEAIVFR